MKSALRRILTESARLDVPAESLADDADLYAAGLSSLATVHLMLAVEDEFNIEIPDRMLTRRLFSSIDALAAAVTELQQGTGGRMNAPVQAAVLTANADHAAAAAAQIVEEVRQASAEPSWLAATRRVAQVAAQHAAAVDRDARFPMEAFEAMRRERLLSAMVPARLGGAGLTLSEIARICETLGHACSSTAMVYAMHQSQVACLVDQGNDVPWIRQTIARLIDEQWLLASATSEETIGGNMRNSACAVELTDGAFRIEKLAPTISYGAHADCILVTARRSADASPSDQVLIVAPRDTLVLEKRGGWDALGMRGTCSEGFRLTATGRAEQILPVPFAQIADQTMLPVSHTLWAAVWVGITSDAVNRAHQFFRAQARGKPGTLPPSAGRLANAVAQLRMMQARLKDALDAASVASTERVARDAREACDFDTPLGASLSLASDMNTLKLSISSAALEVVQETLMICGMAGYKNNTEYSVGRHLRDLFSRALDDQQRPHPIKHGKPAARAAHAGYGENLGHEHAHGCRGH